MNVPAVRPVIDVVVALVFHAYDSVPTPPEADAVNPPDPLPPQLALLSTVIETFIVVGCVTVAD